MKCLNKNMQMYQNLLKETELQVTYRKLIGFINKLQAYFKDKYPEYEVSKGLYQGYLDLSFFTFTTDQLKSKQLKIAVVFLHKEMRFEAWLSGRNRSIMSTYHNNLKGYDLGEYLLSNDEKGMASIIEGILISNPNFDDLKGLTVEIEHNTFRFVNDIQDILSDKDRI